MASARLSDVTDRWRHCLAGYRAGVPLQTIPGPECCNAPGRQKCPPLAQERAQWRCRANWRGMARDGPWRPRRRTSTLAFSARACSSARASVGSARFLPKKGPKGTEKVQVWYRSGRKLAVFLGFTAPGVRRVPDKTPWMKDRVSPGDRALLEYPRDPTPAARVFPRRVRYARWLRVAAIPRRVAPSWRKRRISASASCSAGSGSRCCPSPASRKPNAMLPTRSPWRRLWLRASLVRSPIASRSHWETAAVRFSTSLPAAEPVSSELSHRYQGDAAALQQFAQGLDAAGESVGLGQDHEPFTWPASTIASSLVIPGRFRLLHQRHGPDLSPPAPQVKSHAPPAYLWTRARSRLSSSVTCYGVRKLTSREIGSCPCWYEGGSRRSHSGGWLQDDVPGERILSAVETLKQNRSELESLSDYLKLPPKRRFKPSGTDFWWEGLFSPIIVRLASEAPPRHADFSLTGSWRPPGY